MRVLRVLSLPCATGEEPYSIAITLLESGLSADRFHITAVDLNKQALYIAQRATYSDYSFRHQQQDLRTRYFNASPSTASRSIQTANTRYCLQDQIQKTVHFMSGNAADSNFWASLSLYHLFFCRNLLIYFDTATKERTLRSLERLLNPGGLLFVGHAETGLLFNRRLAPVHHPFAFAFRKPISEAIERINALQNHCSASSHPSSKRHRNPIAAQKQASTTHPPLLNFRTTSDAPSPTNLLNKARTYANQGNLGPVIQLCQAYLNYDKTSAEAYLLLGQAQQAMGKDAQAEQAFQRAIYLQPHHQAALTHLAQAHAIFFSPAQSLLEQN